MKSWLPVKFEIHYLPQDNQTDLASYCTFFETGHLPFKHGTSSEWLTWMMVEKPPRDLQAPGFVDKLKINLNKPMLNVHILIQCHIDHNTNYYGHPDCMVSFTQQ